MNRTLLVFASASGFLAVGAGAFGTHALRDRLSAELLEVFQTGAHYHLILSVALLALALAGGRLGRGASTAGLLWSIGIVVFSGSLYTLALTGERMWGAVTPIGGACILAGWLVLLVSALRQRKSPSPE